MNLLYIKNFLFLLYFLNRVYLINCKTDLPYVTYDVTPGFEKFVDDKDQKARIQKNMYNIEKELTDQYKNQKLIDESLKALERNGVISSTYSTNSLNNNIVFQESTIDLMEAPVFLIEPPLLLPNEEIESDEFASHLLKRSGLEKIHESVDRSDVEKLKDPNKITNLYESQVAKALFKQELKSLLAEKKILLERMEELEGEVAVENDKNAHTKLAKCSRSTHELDSKINDYMDKIDRVNRVRRAIIKRDGHNIDLEDEEEDIEALERDIERYSMARNTPQDKVKEENLVEKEKKDEKFDNDDTSEYDEGEMGGDELD